MRETSREGSRHAQEVPRRVQRDVVALARRGQLTQAEIACDFGILETILRRWLRQADIDDGKTDGVTSAEQDELVRLRRRARILEQENEILRRAAAYLRQGLAPKGTHPLVVDLAADGILVE